MALILMSQSHNESDPEPLPPLRPDDDSCCQSGCDPCIFDFYAEEMEKYRREHAAWQARQASHKTVSEGGA